MGSVDVKWDIYARFRQEASFFYMRFTRALAGMMTISESVRISGMFSVPAFFVFAG